MLEDSGFVLIDTGAAWRHYSGSYDLLYKPGVVVTVEPGIYIPEEGIGIRIEDVVLVTRDAPVLLSRNMPRTVAEIEATMSK